MLNPLINPESVNIIHAEKIEPQAVEWLWYPYIPFGKITLIQGDPGDGKSIFALTLAALLTRGHHLPFTDTRFDQVNVIYQNTEDDAADTVVPRFVQAGGDLQRLSFCCSSAPYFYEAVKLRYPEYCQDINRTPPNHDVR